jgi:hypothetical protein
VCLSEGHGVAPSTPLDGPNESLGKRVQVWTPGRQEQRLHSAVSQQAPEAGRVERVSVQNEGLLPNELQERCDCPVDACTPDEFRSQPERRIGALVRAGGSRFMSEDGVADRFEVQAFDLEVITTRLH